MRHVFFEKGALVIKKIAQPQLSVTDVLIKVQYAYSDSLYGTESLIEKQQGAGTISAAMNAVVRFFSRGFASYSVSKKDCLFTNKSLDYGCVGTVIAVGTQVTHIRVGDTVACIVSGSSDYADMVVVFEQLVVVLPKDTDAQDCSLIALGTYAIDVVMRAHLVLGQTVWVIGLSPLGLLITQLAKIAGCSVIVSGDNNDREKAIALGADYGMADDSEQWDTVTSFIPSFDGIDCVIITDIKKYGNNMSLATKRVKKYGRMVFAGGAQTAVEYTWLQQQDLLIEVVMQEKNGQAKRHVMKLFIDLVHKKRINVRYCISLYYDFTTLVDSCKNDLGKDNGVLIVFPQEQKDVAIIPATYLKNSEQSSSSTFKSARKILSIGVVGVSPIIESALLPALSKMSAVSIDTIAGVEREKALDLSSYYGAKRIYSDGNMACLSDGLDVLMLSGASSAIDVEHIIQALSQGKAIFSERPFLYSEKAYALFSTFLKKNPGMPVCIGYSRSFSPLIQKIKWEIARKVSPVMIYYRINASSFHDQATGKRDGIGGSVINHAADIFDVFCFLTGSRPVSVSVESLRAYQDSLFPTDNFSVQVSFDDGSVCSLIHTTLGSAAMTAERMELFYDGKTIIMDDYSVVKGYGTSLSFDEVMTNQDKGYDTLLQHFFAALHKKAENPLPAERMMAVSHLTVIVDQLVCQGGGEKQLS